MVDNVERVCMSLMQNPNIPDDIKDVLSVSMHDYELSETACLNVKVRYVEDVLLHPFNWNDVIMLIAIGRHDSTMVSRITNRIAPLIRENGGVDELLNYLYMYPR